MNVQPLFLVVFLTLAGAWTGLGQTITWSGGGDASSWFDTNNWAGHQVPGPANNVVINSGLGTNVIVNNNATVLSIQCAKDFVIANGTFTVTSGSSLLQGSLEMTAGSGLAATGAGASFTGEGPTSADGAVLDVSGGALVSLPGLQSFSTDCGGLSWTATGSASVLDLPGLTNMIGPNCGLGGRIEATAGGRVLATNLASITESGDPVTIQADGAGSLVNFNHLQTVTGQGYIINFEASNGGTNLVPQLVGGPGLGVILNPGGTLPLSQIQQLSSITDNGVSATFPALTNMDGAVITVNAGEITLPALQNYSTECELLSWTVTGSNSVLHLPVLTAMMGPYCGFGGRVLATAGGQILAPNLLTITELGDPVTIQADGAGSLVDFSALEDVMTQNGFIINFEASAGGTNLVPRLVGGQGLGVTLNPGGVLPLAQIQQLSALTANGVSATFPALTNIDGALISVNSGAVVTLPALVNYSTECGLLSWTVTGSNSVLNLPELVSMAGPYCGLGGRVLATAGGQILAPNLLTITELGDPVTIQADGAGSLVNFSRLQTVMTQNGFIINFEASGGGTNLVPQLVDGQGLGVTLNPGGTLPLAQIQQLSTLTANGVTATFPALTNIDGAIIVVSGGAAVTLPAVKDYSTECGHLSWTVTGSNSVLDLPGLTNMMGPSCGGGGQIEAMAGGWVLATNLASITESGDPVTIQADGSGSLVNFSRLQTVMTQNGFIINFEASDGGTNLVPQLVGGQGLGVTLNAGGTLPVAQIQQLTRLTANGVTATFSALTNMDGDSMTISDGAVVTLPALVSYSAADAGPTWQVSGADTVLNLPALTNLVGSLCCLFNIQATTGGNLMLGGLQVFQTGDVSFLSDGTNSVIDLSHLSEMVIQAGQGSLTAQDGGQILLNTNAFLLANVAIDIQAAGTGSATLVASPTLTLYGQAWNSYMVEERNTLVPNSPFTFVARVPLTNTFEAFDSVPPPNAAFLITEFVADPPILDVSGWPGQGQLVLYGAPAKTYQIQSTTNLNASMTWTPGSVAVMTNSFRIFPLAPATTKTLFFRAKKE